MRPLEEKQGRLGNMKEETKQPYRKAQSYKNQKP